MKTKKPLLITFSIVAVTFAVVAFSQADEKKKRVVQSNPQIDYGGFLELSNNVQSIRQKRLVSIEKFNEMAKEEGTIILDTRSQKAFEDVHIKNAIHLNFSDFTEEKLAKVIPSKDTRILIYCNNNFKETKMPALVSKSPPLALNVPTFINLQGYGYTNVYELNDALTLADARVKLVGKEVEKRKGSRG